MRLALEREKFSDAASFLQGRITLSFALVYAAAWALYVPFYWYILDNKVAAVLCALGGCVTAGYGAWQILRHQRIQSGGMWANMGGCLTLLVIACVTGGVYSPIQGWIFFGSITTFLCHGRRGGLLIVGTSWIGILIIDALDLGGFIKGSGFPFAITDRPFKFFIVLANSTTIPALGVVTMLFDKLIRQAFLEANLAKKKVEEQHLDLKVLFESLSAGVFTITSDGKIGSNYSGFLVTLLGEENLAGLPAISTVFKNSRISPDELSLMKNIIEAILGEDAVSFELNKGSLPRDVIIQRNSTSLFVEIDWNPIINQKGIVEKILVALQDTTEKRILRDQAYKANEEIGLMQELMESEHSLFLVSYRNGLKLIEHNRQLIEANIVPEPEVLKILLMNIHTIKGECRSLNLSQIVNCSHVIESSYADFLKRRASTDWNQCRALEQLDGLLQLYQRYDNIAQEKLGRHADNQYISLDRQRLISLLEQLPSVRTSDYSTVEVANAKLVSYLEHRVFASLPSLVQEFSIAVQRLARDLDKQAPDIETRLVEVCLRESGVNVLRKAFVHILRNTMDHGLEPSSERLENGKPPKGRICIAADWQSDELRILVEDDGRGLDIPSLRQKGVARGFCRADDPLEKIAELIFMEGMSTAAGLSHISGRGIGMNAVRQFMEEVGGRVTLKLHLETFTGKYLPFALEMTLPRSHIHAYEYQSSEFLKAEAAS